MRELKHPEDGGNNAGDSANVVSFARAVEKRQEREPAVTDEELIEYRRMLPILRAMIREREMLLSAEGCPVMRGILGAVD